MLLRMVIDVGLKKRQRRYSSKNRGGRNHFTFRSIPYKKHPFYHLNKNYD